MKFTQIVLILITFFGVHFAVTTLGMDRPTQTPNISIEVKNAKISDVLENIADDTGYNFLIDKDLADLTISIKVLNGTLDSVLNRLLRGQNYAIIWDETNKSISISIYGKQNTKWTSITSSSSSILRQRPQKTLPLSGQTPNFDQASSTLDNK